MTQKRDPDPVDSSSQADVTCTFCLQPRYTCGCQIDSPGLEAGPRVVRINLSIRTVTRVLGLKVDGQVLAQIARQLKAACGTQCVVRDGWIDLQGDHAERVTEWLIAQGWQMPVMPDLSRDVGDMRGVRWG